MSRVDGDDPLVYTVRDLNQRTASIISEIEMAGKPAFITRHGRFVAMITPLAAGQVESRVLAEMAREIGEPTATDLQLLGTDRRQAPGCLPLLTAGFAVELPVLSAAYEGIPLCWGEVQDSPSWVLAVANPDRVAGQACDFYAVSVVCAKRAFYPCTVRIASRIPIAQ